MLLCELQSIQGLDLYARYGFEYAGMLVWKHVCMRTFRYKIDNLRNVILCSHTKMNTLKIQNVLITLYYQHIDNVLQYICFIMAVFFLSAIPEAHKAIKMNLDSM